MSDQDFSHLSPELREIGAALASAASDQPVELTSDQRDVLARATIADTFDAILSHKHRGEIRDSEVDPIADRWASELRTAFAEYAPLRKLIAELDDQDAANLDRAITAISQDDRLTVDEREQIVSDLRKRDRRERRRHATNSVALQDAASNGVYLESVSVKGFRGIGPKAVLSLEPKPGLTLIYGTNGSGKSSFVEALDVLLTGTTARFDQRGPEWQSSWFNVDSPAHGGVEGTFVGPKAGSNIALHRNWIGSRLFSSADEHPVYVQDPDKQIERLGWQEALTHSKPILGYAELGPLFEEEASRLSGETTLARHIRLRAGIGDSLTEGLAYSAAMPIFRGTIRALVSDWSESTRRRGRLPGWLGDILSDHRDMEGMPVLPRQLPWIELARGVMQRRGSAFSSSDRAALRILFGIAQVYLDGMTTETQNALAEAAAIASEARIDVHGLTHQDSRYYRFRRALYCRSLVEAIHQSRLDRFSRSVEENWSAIRKGSAVRFDRLTLQEPDESPRRVLLGLSVNGVSVERGVLSQGELHALALCIFLPTMMKRESPFRFAVIDDPVQVMDGHAVDGLARVLREAAKDLQVVVFTHDERLPDSLEKLAIDHTLIEVSRSSKSTVRCDVIGDPASQALRYARIEAEEPDHDNWTEIGLFCRQAIEHACIRAARAKWLAEGGSPQDVQKIIDTIGHSERTSTSTKKLIALALWRTESRQGEVANYLESSWGANWGMRPDELINLLNGLAHGDQQTSRTQRKPTKTKAVPKG